MTIKEKKFLVVGLGKSGVACARFLKDRGGVVTATDGKSIDDLGEAVQKLKDLGIKIEAGGHNIETFLDCDLIVLSPGVPMSIEPIREAKKRGIEVISEIELAYNFIKTPIVAITGSNGKTTTTTLVGQILKRAHKEVFVGGNIGNPLIEYIELGREAEYVVAEISSFQLEGIRSFRPRVVIMLNISPDHLDRYLSYQDYIAAKARIFLNQREGDFAILNADDSLVSEMTNSFKDVRKVYFSQKKKMNKGIYLYGNSIVSEIGGQKHCYSTEFFKIRGVHNIDNIMASIAAAEICGCNPGDIQDAVNSFKGLEHRLEFVEEISGVKYYNDSKATNIGAVEKSLESFEEPIILIAGGRDKGTGYESLNELVKERVKKLILIGEAKEIILKSLGSLTQSLKADTLEEAVELAWSQSSYGDIVLLSPACSSYDMFNNYEERGEAFKAIVRELKSKTDNRIGVTIQVGTKAQIRNP
ncbi:MAG: UDP-N-acetylmuramoyl-L-alanine--D-glutamate ligase [Desulfobacteria bacterium]